MNKPPAFSPQELAYLQDTDFLLTKRKVIHQLQRLMGESQQQLQKVLQEHKAQLPPNCLQRAGKISRGENYCGLPYLVLDYPRLLQKEDIFSFRSMCWWGHFFSCTLHLQGKSLRPYLQPLEKSLLQKDKLPADTWLCVNHTPWDYHYGRGNYRLLHEMEPKEIQKTLQKDFIKLSRKIPLEAYGQLPAFACQTFRLFLDCLQQA